MEMGVLRRKIELVLALVKDGETETLSQRAAIYAASRLLLEDIERMIENPEFMYKLGPNVGQGYILEQSGKFRSSVYYHLGFSDYTDVAQGDAENAIHYGQKLLGLLNE